MDNANSCAHNYNGIPRACTSSHSLSSPQEDVGPDRDLGETVGRHSEIGALAGGAVALHLLVAHNFFLYELGCGISRSRKDAKLRSHPSLRSGIALPCNQQLVT